MEGRILIRDGVHKEFLVYAMAPSEWDRFVAFYNDTDANGDPMPGVRHWLAENEVHIADAWTVMLSDSVLLMIAVDVESTDWTTITHFREFLLNQQFLEIQPQPVFQVPLAV